MTQEEQRKYDERRLETLEEDYNHIKGVADALRNDIYDLTLEERVPDARERQLMTGRRYALESLQENIRETIVFLRKRIQANKPEPWEEVSTHHCGQDADMDDACCQAAYDPNESQPVDTKPAITGESLKELVGWQVVSVNGEKCDYCVTRHNAPCVKVELVGGYFLCLAPQQDKRNVISFEEDDEESLGDIMAKIKEDTDAFMDYLDSIVNNK